MACACTRATTDKAPASLAWGNGLRGMRERFEALAGRVDVETRAGGGVEVHGVMPRSQA